MTTWLVQFGLGLARMGGWEEPVIPPPEIREVEVIREVPLEIREVEVIREVPSPPEIREVEIVKEVVKEVEVVREVEVIKEVVKEVEVIREVEIIKEVDVVRPRYEIPEDLVREARIRVREQDDRWPERESETKRAAVYRVLTNSFPDASKRDVSRAIEEAVCLDC